MRVMDTEQARAILRKVKYRDWELLIYPHGYDEGLTLQWRAPVICVKTGEPVQLNSMSVDVQPGTATELSLLDAALQLACATELHEAQEHFLYDQRRVFDPHEPGMNITWQRLGTLKMVA
jgi:hypothetical protein